MLKMFLPKPTHKLIHSPGKESSPGTLPPNKTIGILEHSSIEAMVIPAAIVFRPAHRVIEIMLVAARGEKELRSATAPACRASTIDDICLPKSFSLPLC